MFKPATIQRVQGAVNMAAQIIGQQEEANALRSGAQGQPLMTHYERQSATLALAALLLAEDDRQQRTVIIPGRG